MIASDTLLTKMETITTSLRKWEVEILEALTYANSSHTLDDIVAMIVNGQLTLTTHPNSFSLTTIQISPQFKSLHFMIVGGNLEEIISLHDTYVKIAKEHGCSYMSLSGRKGWLPTLKRRGWKHQFTTMSIPV